jgi:RNA polymerase sigma factor (TIGR02999 family)
MAPPDELTQLLTRWREGDKASLDALATVLYSELRRLAGRMLSEERPDHTLQPTALVHEAYLRLIGQHSPDCRDRTHFLSMAASMMRRILINHANARKAGKRLAFTEAISMDEEPGAELHQGEPATVDLLALDQSLEKLTSLDPQQGRVVELRYFGGLSIEETSEVMGISPATVKRDWQTARLWLMQQLNPHG